MKIQFEIGPNQRRALVGALIAASFFLIEAGVIEILLGLDQDCRQAVESLRLAPDPFSACMPEWEWMFMHSASRGFLWLFSPSSPAFLASIIMGVFYSIVGAFSATTFKNKGIILYLVLHAFLVSTIAGLSYLGRYIA
jgi:hypothetical protein